MAERRYGISFWLLKKSANEWNIFSNTRKLVIFSLVCSIWNLWIFKYRKCSVRHPLSNKPPPSDNPPFFQGKKVNKPPSLLGPPPTPNYSPLINDRLYYAPINVMAAGGGGVGMGWGFDCRCWPWGRAFDWFCSPKEGDIWIFLRPRWRHLTADSDEKTESEHMFPASALQACAVRSGNIRKSWRPTETSESWVDFTVLSPNFVCFGVFLINWTS